jgi:outer membrane protein, heavy metal efflux system
MQRYLLLLILISTNLRAQKKLLDKNFSKTLTYKEYLDLATRRNLLLAAEKYKLAEADARISIARIYPDPEFTFGDASGDITGQNLQQQFYVGISQAIPLGHKYRKGIDVAKTEKELSIALYEDYLRVFKLDITKRFINVLIAQMDHEKNSKTNDMMQTELKNKESSGEIKGIELYRLQIEAGQILDQLYQSEAELEHALYELYIPLSTFNKDSTITVKGSLDIPFKKFNIDSIVPIALEERTDAVMAKKRFLISQEHQALTKANRHKELTLILGNNSYSKATNYIAPTPAYHAVTAMVSFPLAFSRLKKGDLQLAELKKQEAANEKDHIQNIIKIEIYQSYDRYIIAEKQLQIYSKSLLQSADKLLEEELVNYKNGKTSFLDLSESHRKRDEVYLSYFRTLKAYIYSLVELEDDMGIWDIEFK